MQGHTFFVASYDPDSSVFLGDVCEQIQQAIDGKRAIVTAPSGIMVEQFDVGEREEWED